jgi:hypothetical protein
MSILRELQLFFFLGSIVGAALITSPTLKSFPVHYNIHSEPDRFVQHGQFLIPAILFVLYASSFFAARNDVVQTFRSQVTLVTSVLLLVLQLHGSVLASGHNVPLPRFVVPAFLAVIAIVILTSVARTFLEQKTASSDKKTEKKQEKQPEEEKAPARGRSKSPRGSKSPRSPRSLIKQLASPQSPATTPTRPSPRGRSQSPRLKRELKGLETKLLK